MKACETLKRHKLTKKTRCEGGSFQGQCEQAATLQVTTPGGIQLAVCSKHNTKPPVAWWNACYVIALPWKPPKNQEDKSNE